MLPFITTMASSSPVSLRAAVRRSGYFLLSLNLRVDLYLFGHFGDGSPHLNIVRRDTVDHEGFVADCDRLEKELYLLIKKWGGSASSEHGVGLLKKSWVELSRSSAEMALFKAIKTAFDPNHLLNPGKIFSL